MHTHSTGSLPTVLCEGNNPVETYMYILSKSEHLLAPTSQRRGRNLWLGTRYLRLVMVEFLIFSAFEMEPHLFVQNGHGTPDDILMVQAWFVRTGGGSVTRNGSSIF